MKTSRQDIQDLLSQLAADIEEIKTMLNGNGSAVGTTANADAVADTDATGKANAISNDVVVSNSTVRNSTSPDYTAISNATATDYATAGKGSATINPDRNIAAINRRLELIAQTCGKLPDRIKSYHSQMLLHIVRDLREELNRDNDTRKRKGLPTIENKIDNSLTMLVSIYDRLNQLEDAMMPDTPQQGQIGEMQFTCGISVHGKSSKSGIMAWLQSAWSGVRRFLSTRPTRWYRNPYILCAIVIYLLYSGLSIFSWQQWHHYRDENARLHLAADKYRVDSIILREVYPQAAITLSAYEHITEIEGVDAAIEVFREDINVINCKSR